MPLPLWTRTRWTRALTTRLLRPTGRPLLVLSLPRSGSTWLGGMLGSARDALYFHEPFTQSYLRADGDGTFVAVDRDGAPAEYEQALTKVLDGDPTFPRDHGIIDDPRAWTIRLRPRARVVVKEVNPFAAAWFVERLDPRVILLVRHPVAVALSCERRGWRWQGDDRTVQWGNMGRQFGDAMAHALTMVERAHAHRVVAYEAACEDPITTTRELAEFAGVRQMPRVAEGGGAELSVPTASRAHAWRRRVERDRVPSAAIAALRDGWCSADVPWYRDDAEWTLSG